MPLNTRNDLQQILKQCVTLQLDSSPEPLSSEMNTQPFGQTGQMIQLCSEYLSVRCI